jgi:hypothetical protein
VELSPEVFIALCSGDLAFDEARTKQGCHFSGEKTSELASVFPTKN